MRQNGLSGIIFYRIIRNDCGGAFSLVPTRSVGTRVGDALRRVRFFRRAERRASQARVPTRSVGTRTTFFVKC